MVELLVLSSSVSWEEEDGDSGGDKELVGGFVVDSLIGWFGDEAEAEGEGVVGWGDEGLDGGDFYIGISLAGVVDAGGDEFCECVARRLCFFVEWR